MLTATVFFCLAVTNTWFSKHLISPFETAYAPIPDYARFEDLPPALRSCKFIAVLGSGNGDAAGRAALDELSPGGLARLTAAVRIARLLPETKIIFSGSTPEDRRPNARVMREAAISLGINPERISLIEGVRDTNDEAKQLWSRLAGQSFILISSAWHLPRAVGLCRKQGLNPIPVPTDFLSTPSNRNNPVEWNWSYDSLERSTWAFHESLGLVWTNLRKQR
jgi:uncharacterized SAM-binding protein YcdF (DUF218 family)